MIVEDTLNTPSSTQKSGFGVSRWQNRSINYNTNQIRQLQQQLDLLKVVKTNPAHKRYSPPHLSTNNSKEFPKLQDKTVFRSLGKRLITDVDINQKGGEATLALPQLTSRKIQNPAKHRPLNIISLGKDLEHKRNQTQILDLETQKLLEFLSPKIESTFVLNERYNFLNRGFYCNNVYHAKFRDNLVLRLNKF